MSNDAFALNNEDPENIVAGRGHRNRRPTATIEQYRTLSVVLVLLPPLISSKMTIKPS
jgi:hypothetical protein